MDNKQLSSCPIQGGQNAKFLIAQKIQVREESVLPLRLLQYFNRKALESSLAGPGMCSSPCPSSPTTSDIPPHPPHHLLTPVIFKQKLQKQKLFCPLFCSFTSPHRESGIKWQKSWTELLELLYPCKK